MRAARLLRNMMDKSMPHHTQRYVCFVSVYWLAVSDLVAWCIYQSCWAQFFFIKSSPSFQKKKTKSQMCVCVCCVCLFDWNAAKQGCFECDQTPVFAIRSNCTRCWKHKLWQALLLLSSSFSSPILLSLSLSLSYLNAQRIWRSRHEETKHDELCDWWRYHGFGIRSVHIFPRCSPTGKLWCIIKKQLFSFFWNTFFLKRE